MERMRKTPEFKKRLLLNGVLFVGASTTLFAYALLDLYLNLSGKLRAMVDIEISSLSDLIFVIAVPVFIVGLIVNTYFLYGILAKITMSRRAGHGAMKTPFGRAEIRNIAQVPVNYDEEERGIVVTVV